MVLLIWKDINYLNATRNLVLWAEFLQEVGDNGFPRFYILISSFQRLSSCCHAHSTLCQPKAPYAYFTLFLSFFSSFQYILRVSNFSDILFSLCLPVISTVSFLFYIKLYFLLPLPLKKISLFTRNVHVILSILL